MVFLAPTKMLVLQQAEVLKMHTCLVVGDYTGDKGIDFWNHERWVKEMQLNEILVMTPQIFLDNIRRSFVHVRMGPPRPSRFEKPQSLRIDDGMRSQLTRFSFG